MRINVYGQELTKEVAIVRATARDTGLAHAGVRLFLASPDVLHHTETDDDRSAITFWLPEDGAFTALDLAEVFERAADMICES